MHRHVLALLASLAPLAGSLAPPLARALKAPRPIVVELLVDAPLLADTCVARVAVPAFPAADAEGALGRLARCDAAAEQLCRRCAKLGRSRAVVLDATSAGGAERFAHWRDALPADVAAQIGAPASLCKPRKQEEQGPLFFTRISCKQTYDLAWRHSVCAHFGLTPSLM